MQTEVQMHEVIAESQELIYTDKDHAAEMLRGHDSLRSARLLCDVTLCVDGKKFPCHKTVLVSSSSYFKAMFTGLLSESKQKDVIIKDVDPATLQKLLEFMYTSTLVVTANTVHSLLSTSNLFQILPAKTACCQYLEQQISMENCYSIHRMADTYACPDLYAKARDFIIENFSKLDKHQDFLNLSIKELLELISSDSLDMANEETVFDAITLWNNFNPGERNDIFHKILEHVRLPVLSPYFLCREVEQFHAVKNCSKCLSLLDEAKRFHFLPDLRMEMRPEWTRFRKFHAFQEVLVSLMPCSQTGPVAQPNWAFGQQSTANINIDLFLVEGHHIIPEVSFGTALKPLPQSQKLQGMAALESTLYLFGGESTNGVAVSDVYKYNLEYDLWTCLTSMPTSRCQPGTALLYGSIYVLGGRNGTDWLNSVECYNPHMNTWEKGIDMPVALQHVTSVAFKGCIYASGIPVSIANSQKGCNALTVMLCYNSATKSWSELPPMPCPCYGSTAYVNDDRICLIGGKNIGLESTRTIQNYDPKEKKWSILTSSLLPHYRPGVVVVNGVTFLGYDNSYADKQGMFEYKHEKSNTWQMEVQELKKDYVQWTRCAVLQIRKDTLIEWTKTYQNVNALR